MLNQAIDFSDLPAPAESLLAVIRYCSEDETSSDHLAELIKLEPILTAELLKIVNSPYYGFVSEITSIDRMTVMMGLKAIRSLALCIAMRDVSKNNKIAGFDDQLYWQDAVRRGVISSMLGKQLNFDKDECFTAGLLQDIGLLVLFSQDDKHGDFVKNYRHYNPDLRALLEQDEFSATHNDVASFLSSQWALPDTLVNAISAHHHQPPQEIQLCNILYCTDWLNALFTLQDKEGIYHQCSRLLMDQLNFDEQQINSIITQLPAEVSSVAQALGYKVDVEEDFDEIIKGGNKRLAEHNLELQELTWRLKNTMDERDKLSEELNREIQIARDVQNALLPLPNPELPVYAFNVPARDLSGDFYDYFTLDDGNIYFCLGDVSGKGVYASLLMVKTSSLFRSLCNTNTPLETIAERMNDELCRVVVRGMFITMVIGYYDPASQEVRLVNAGHPPVLYLDKVGQCVQVDGHSPPLGIIAGQQYQGDLINIEGGCIYLYSDGVTESCLGSPADESSMLGIKGLATLLKRLHDKPVASRLQVILNAFQKSQEELHDDTTMLLVDGGQ